MGKSSFQPSVYQEIAGISGEIKAYLFRLPMQVKFRGITVREGILFRGPARWAEFSPFWGYSPSYSARWLMGALDSAFREAPRPFRKEIPVNVTIPAVDAETAVQIASRINSNTAKVKVAEAGQTPEADLRRLAAVREVLGTRAKIRIDVNGKWDLATAITLLPQYDRAAGGLEYVEQPCESVEDLAYLRRQYSNIRIAADESIRRSADPFSVFEKDAADLLVVKNQPLGGVRAVLELLEFTQLPAVVSSALESSAGLSTGLQLAAALPNLPYACGLATATLFASDVSSEPLIPENGQLLSREVTPDLLLYAYQQIDTPYNSSVEKENEGKMSQINALLPSAEVWHKWNERLAQVWEFCQDQMWISRKLHCDLAPLPQCLLGV